MFDRNINLIRSDGVASFLQGVWNSGTAQVALLYEATVLATSTGKMVRSFEQQSDGVMGAEPSIAFAFKFNYMGVSINPVQQKQEITELLELLKSHKVSSVVEIGTDKGGTLFLFSRVAAPNAKIVSMNLPWSPLNAYCMKYRNRLYKKFATSGQELNLLSINSHEQSSADKVRKLIGTGGVDFLFIDGDHSYEGVKQDFEMYSTMVKKGGIVAFHDIADYRSKHNPVRSYWDEIKSKYKHKEICYSNGNGFGIGVIYL